jgi:hypothetical protein
VGAGGARGEVEALAGLRAREAAVGAPGRERREAEADDDRDAAALARIWDAEGAGAEARQARFTEIALDRPERGRGCGRRRQERREGQKGEAPEQDRRLAEPQ